MGTDKVKIAIGTNSNYKVNAIKKALYGLDIDFEAVFDKADSLISEQPKVWGETRIGSINRAKNILQKFPDSDFGIGVEFGYEPIEGKYHMVCFASIVTKDGQTFTEASSTLELPQLLVDALNNNTEVDNALNSVIEKLPDSVAARKYIEFIKKRKVIYECVENVVLRWVFRDLY